MKLFFLRHTSLNVDTDVFYGQTDLDVSTSFDKEVSKIIKKLIDFNIDTKCIKTFTSPLVRCIKLTKELKQDYEI